LIDGIRARWLSQVDDAATVEVLVAEVRNLAARVSALEANERDRRRV